MSPSEVPPLRPVPKKNELGALGVPWSPSSSPFLPAGTSNWSGDYFVQTAGSALVVNQTQSGAGATVPGQLRAVFERDWSSPYSADIGDAGRWERLCGSR